MAQYEFCPPVCLERSYSCPVQRTVRLSAPRSDTVTNNSDLYLPLPSPLPIASEVNTPDDGAFLTAFDLGLKMGVDMMEGKSVEELKKEKEKLDREMREIRMSDVSEEESVNVCWPL